MKIIITRQNPGFWAASYICQRLQNAHGDRFTLGLPTGGTAVDMYAELCTLAHEKKLSFQNVLTFNMDEYAALPPDHPQSYHYYMYKHLFDQVDIPPQNIHLPDGCAANLAAECRTYEQAIAQAGGVDLFLGGIGRNGHIAFNEPGSAFDSRTRVIKLAESTREANARFFNGNIQAVPTHALTVGIGTILDAKELLFLATGDSKAEAVAQLAQGEITPQWPLTALRTHPLATLLIDTAAASALSKKTISRMEKNENGDLILEL